MTIHYSVNFKEKEVVSASSLGIGNWVDGMDVKNTSIASVSTSWKPVYGKRILIKDGYTQRIITLSKPGLTDGLQLIVRVYNEGIAIK